MTAFHNHRTSYALVAASAMSYLIGEVFFRHVVFRPDLRHVQIAALLVLDWWWLVPLVVAIWRGRIAAWPRGGCAIVGFLALLVVRDAFFVYSLPQCYKQSPATSVYDCILGFDRAQYREIPGNILIEFANRL